MGTVEIRMILGFLLVKLLDDKIDLPHLLVSPPLMAIMLLSNLYIATIVKKQM